MQVGSEGLNIVPTGLGQRIHTPQETYAVLTKRIFWSQNVDPMTGGIGGYFKQDITKAFSTGRFSTAQSLFVDNSTCRQGVQITTDLGIRMMVPPFCYAMLPLLCTVSYPFLEFRVASIASYSVTGTGVGSTTFAVLNAEHTPFLQSAIKDSSQYGLEAAVSTSNFGYQFASGTVTGIHSSTPIYTHKKPTCFVVSKIGYQIIGQSAHLTTFGTNLYLTQYPPIIGAPAVTVDATGARIIAAMLAAGTVQANTYGSMIVGEITLDPPFVSDWGALVQGSNLLGSPGIAVFIDFAPTDTTCVVSCNFQFSIGEVYVG